MLILGAILLLFGIVAGCGKSQRYENITGVYQGNIKFNNTSGTITPSQVEAKYGTVEISLNQKEMNITGMIEFLDIKETYELSGGITQNNKITFTSILGDPSHYIKFDGENKKNSLSGNFVMKAPPPLWEASGNLSANRK